jgi:hypothetical protein
MMKVAEIEEAEKDKMRNKCKKIIDHGITCFINRQLIYNFPEQIFTEAGVISIEHADFDGECAARLCAACLLRAVRTVWCAYGVLCVRCIRWSPLYLYDVQLRAIEIQHVWLLARSSLFLAFLCSHYLRSFFPSTFTGIERLAAVTGGEIASTFDKPELVNLGECKLIDEIMVGEDRLIRFSGCKSGTACTIILRGASSHLLGRCFFCRAAACRCSTLLTTCIVAIYAKPQRRPSGPCTTRCAC